jgi:hypothetical protein
MITEARRSLCVAGNDFRRKDIHTIQVVIPIAALVMVLMAAATCLLLRRFFAASSGYAEATEPLDLSWKDYRPLSRLLDPADFEYLRQRGVSEASIAKLRVERRKIYRLCLRSLAKDFNQVYRCVNLVLIQSRIDRPELAAELARQKLTFYRNLLQVEFRLTVHACGMERMPAIDLLQPFEALQAQLRQLAVAGAAA